MTSEQALKAAENEPWDPSVRALVAFPPLLTKMNNELEWTQKLGDAFLIQEAQLMSTVQALRERAYAAGHLKDQEHITVQRQEKVIVIEPRTPEVVYVPVYDTRVVYGDWMWREYPPIHWPYPDYYSGGSYVYWGVGAGVSSAFYFSTFYWPQRQIVVINHHHRPNYYYRHRDIIRMKNVVTGSIIRSIAMESYTIKVTSQPVKCAGKVINNQILVSGALGCRSKATQ